MSLSYKHIRSLNVKDCRGTTVRFSGLSWPLSRLKGQHIGVSSSLSHPILKVTSTYNGVILTFLTMIGARAGGWFKTKRNFMAGGIAISYGRLRYDRVG